MILLQYVLLQYSVVLILFILILSSILFYIFFTLVNIIQFITLYLFRYYEYVFILFTNILFLVFSKVL